MSEAARRRDPLDGSGPVREGEQLDVEALTAWLADRVPGLSGTPRVTQYAGGASNWTYRLEYPDHDLVLRRPPAGTKAKSAHDMGREATVQTALRPVYPYVPEVVARCEDESVIGADFYVMRRIPGVVLRRDVPPGVTLDAGTARALCLNAVGALVGLHAVDPSAAGLESFGRGPGYARRQIEGWSDRYVKARTWNVPSFRTVRRWLADHTPEDVATCVIHGDFRLDNLVLDPDDLSRIRGVLDWEMATLGDPLMDLGNSLAYWVEAGDDRIARSTRRQPTHLPGMLTRRELVDAYCERSGRQRPANWTFYEVYGLFRLAVIAQQIYYRYHHRQTRNPAFRHFWIAVRYLDRRCRKLIRRAG
jgi:aminoglycoside phosphotransferase (APT) family kinase protein